MVPFKAVLFVVLISTGGIAHADGDRLCRTFTTLPDYFSHLKAVQYVKTGVVEKGFEPKFSREFYAAILGQSDDLAKLLAVRDKSKPFETDILRATVEAGEIQSVRLLLQAGAPPDLGGYEGGTPLLAAIACKEPMIMSYLLAAGADVYWHSDAYGDAMSSALARDSLEDVRLLLVGGFDPACALYDGPRRQPEALANRLGDADMVLLLSSFRDIRASSHPKKSCTLPAQDKAPLQDHIMGVDFGGIADWPLRY